MGTASAKALGQKWVLCLMKPNEEARAGVRVGDEVREIGEDRRCIL
jgi:hypothetical protein